ncbi:SDR family NAD(P)-dependent oxidoreductase [Salipiger sp. IMCC34102]|uniref:SDR family oxidoreductase n=1 Tax=Salipiger sp. IMCC34102 TaxID=2510647 RepID=UPI00101BF974|nr:SDR family oxidoreductase [Salipiger sp. IMCC34102]RYH04004.1 SDR family NAD(P)-dependent oxidoreductase [Salipiger sp. IMCC34102]
MTDAIVLGGTAGVGRAIVDALVARGMTVGVVARGQDRLDQLKSDYLKGRIRTAAADVGDADALREAINTLCPTGAPRVWVNCAMITAFSRFEQMTVEEFEKIVRTTFLGQVNGTREALRLMGSGNIVHIGSGLAYRPVPGQSAYVASKHAINGFVGSVRSEIMQTRPDLHLSLVQLPAMNTPQFGWARNRLDMAPQPAPPVYHPQVAAEAVLKAIDGNLREVLVGKSVLKLMFGDMALPGYIDRRLSRNGIEMQKSDVPAWARPEEDNLFAPVDHPSSATGAFDGEISETAMTVDSDRARKVLLGGIVAAAFGIGALAASAAVTASRRRPTSLPHWEQRRLNK